MPKLVPPEIVDRIRKKEDEKHRDHRIPLYLPDDHSPPDKDSDREQEETSGVYIIDLVD